MRASRYLLQRLQPSRCERFLAIASCGALLLLQGACGSTADPPGHEDEAMGGSIGNGGVPHIGGAQGSGGAHSAGVGGTGVDAEGGTAGDTAAGGGTGGTGGNPTGGSTAGGVGGNPAGGSGGDSTGGSGGDPMGGSGGGSTGGADAGGAGGNPAGGSGGDPTGGFGGGSTGGADAGGAGPCDDPGTTHSGGTEYCQIGSGDVGNGYHYDFWTNQPGSVCMTVFGDDATFKSNWSDSSDFLSRIGLTYDETRTPDEIGTFSSDFATAGSASGVALMGIHGQTSGPLVEFYIIEDWVNEPGDSAPAFGTPQGTITVDGGTYTVYQERVGDGRTMLELHYSIRTEGRQCGHISISEHFSQWAGMGLQMGQLAQVMLFVEGMHGGSGDYEFTRATLTVQ